MILRHGLVFTGKRFERLDIRVENGVIVQMGENLGEGLDCGGCRLLPGLVDLHTHGCGGWDFDHATAEEIKKMEAIYRSHGTTALLATLMTNPADVMTGAARRCGRAVGETIKGIYLEGPFFAPEKRGAHRADCLMAVDPDFLDELQRAAGGCIRVTAIDPTLPGVLELIASRKDRMRFSLAHTAADYRQAMAGFAAGAGQVTHLFNAMNGLHHREPGLLGAALAGDCTAELICDGVHVHPAVLLLAARALGERLLVISDSMSACGLSDGSYTLGGQAVTVSGQLAALADGTIAGSVTFAYDGMRNLIAAGVAPEQAVFAATTAPAHSAGLEDCGMIAPGRPADLLLAAPDWALRQVWYHGTPQLGQNR